MQFRTLRYDFDALLQNTSILVSRGALYFALREYRLLIALSHNDSRPVRGFCKAARLLLDEEMLAQCQQHRALEAAQYSVETSSAPNIAAWTTSGLAILAAGVATWYGIEMFAQYERAIDADKESERAQVAMDEVAFSRAQSREISAGNDMIDAQRLMYVSAAVAGVASVTAYTLWQLDSQMKVTLVSPISLGVSASF